MLVQAETRVAIDNIEAIAAIDGVDGVFIGPADLSADLGCLGRIEAPDVQGVIESAIGRIIAAGKPAGILTFNETLNRRYLELGASFVAVGADVTELAATLKKLAGRYGRGPGAGPAGSGY
ncbi:5-keto-4-deoxy-D-glucarate aldolase [compost metagenome]